MKNRASVLWLAGAMLLLAFPVRYWARVASGDLFFRPVTPLDGSDPAAARQWIFLRRAREVVPAGATYTVIAPTRDVEMNLFMLSLGLLPEARGLPSSYHGVLAEHGGQARYVLAYENPPPPEEARLRAVFPEGRVYERPGAQR